MKTTEETRAISAAQRTHLETLVQDAQIAQFAVDRFIAYLRDEHDATEAEGWQMRNTATGFVRSCEDSSPPSSS